MKKKDLDYFRDRFKREPTESEKRYIAENPDWKSRINKIQKRVGEILSRMLPGGNSSEDEDVPPGEAG